MEKYEVTVNKKDIEKIFEYRYKLFIDVNRHTPSRNWEEAVLERDLLKKINTIDYVLKTFGWFNDWLKYYKNKEVKQ